MILSCTNLRDLQESRPPQVPGVSSHVYTHTHTHTAAPRLHRHLGQTPLAPSLCSRLSTASRWQGLRGAVTWSLEASPPCSNLRFCVSPLGPPHIITDSGLTSRKALFHNSRGGEFEFRGSGDGALPGLQSVFSLCLPWQTEQSSAASSSWGTEAVAGAP